LERLRDIVEWVSQVRPDKALRCIEVGSWVGESAVAIASGFRHGGTVYCVESFEGDASSDPINRAVATLGKDAIRDYFVQNTAGLPIVLKEGLSQDVAASIDRAQADLVFVDASHEYEAAKADIETWINHVAPDGYLIGDDLSPVYPGVQRAVKELFEDREIPFIQVDGTDLWMVAKAEYDQWLARQK
jgi:predicted O-methyltransferase YrrM